MVKLSDKSEWRDIFCLWGLSIVSDIEGLAFTDDGTLIITDEIPEPLFFR